MSKIALTPSATGTGVFTISSPATNTDRTLTLPDEAGTIITTAGVPSSAMPAGSVVQVAQTRKTDTTWSTASTNFVAVTGLSVTLTPASASSKFLVTVGVSIGSYWWATGGGYFGVFANGAFIAGDGTSWWVYQYGESAANCVEETMQWSEEVLHSPNTTSPVTFSVSLATGNASWPIYVNRAHANSTKRGNSWITVREIAG